MEWKLPEWHRVATVSVTPCPSPPPLFPFLWRQGKGWNPSRGDATSSRCPVFSFVPCLSISPVPCLGRPSRAFLLKMALTTWFWDPLFPAEVFLFWSQTFPLTYLFLCTAAAGPASGAVEAWQSCSAQWGSWALLWHCWPHHRFLDRSLASQSSPSSKIVTPITSVLKPRPNTKDSAPCEEEIKELHPFW